MVVNPWVYVVDKGAQTGYVGSSEVRLTVALYQHAISWRPRTGSAGWFTSMVLVSSVKFVIEVFLAFWYLAK